MSETAACRPPYPVRPELIDPDLIVDLAAQLARVQEPCAPVDTFGPSFEQLRNEQRAAVGNPVRALIEAARKESANDLLLRATKLARDLGGWSSRMRLVEDTLSFFVEVSVGEGRALNEARIRDAKVIVFLSLGGDALPAEFLSRALAARQSGRGEALRILGQIDAQGGLRDALARDIRRGIDEGAERAAAFGVTSAGDLGDLLAGARGLADEVEVGVALSEADLAEIDFARRFVEDSAFRIGVYARVWREQRPAP